MIQSDKSRHNICVAKIKRSTIKPYDFKWTKFHDSNIEFQNLYSNIPVDIADSELIICSTIIDSDNYSILTTRQLITNKNAVLKKCSVLEATNKFYGDFKGYEKKPYTFGEIKLREDNIFEYFIEVGNASMIMIHGVRTIIMTNNMTAAQVENIGRAWNNRLNK
ncbi:hypothetical protein [Ferruginibacter profundus]